MSETEYREAFRQGLRDLGYVEGRLVIEYRVGASKAPPEADSERAREHRLELFVPVCDVAPSDAEVLYPPASKSVGPTPHPAHAGESETASGPAA